MRVHRSPRSSIGAKTGSPDTNDQNQSRSLLKTKCRGLPPESFCTEFSGAGTPITKRVALKGVRHDGARQFKRGALGGRHGKNGGGWWGGGRKGGGGCGGGEGGEKRWARGGGGSGGGGGGPPGFLQSQGVKYLF